MPQISKLAVMLAVVTLITVPASAAEWVFDSSVIRSAQNPREALTLSDPYDLAFIQRVFPNSILKENEEDFISVKGNTGNFLVGGWDGRIAYIEGWNGDFEDVLGNRIGDSLLKALGSDVALCESGESVLCTSQIGSSLKYMVKLCRPDTFPPQGGRYEVSDCDSINGFHLAK